MLAPVTWERILDEARRLSESVEYILPPVEVLDRFREAAREGVVERHVLGRSDKGHRIEAYTTDAGRRTTLWYAYPDPGEAIGGTVLCVLLEALARGDVIFDWLDTRWSWIPCLNLDDQPAEGHRLEPVRGHGRGQEFTSGRPLKDRGDCSACPSRQRGTYNY